MKKIFVTFILFLIFQLTIDAQYEIANINRTFNSAPDNLKFEILANQPFSLTSKIKLKSGNSILFVHLPSGDSKKYCSLSGRGTCKTSKVFNEKGKYIIELKNTGQPKLDLKIIAQNISLDNHLSGSIPNEIFQKAKGLFNSVDSLCALSNNELWGEEINGAFMFTSEEPRIMIANQPDSAGILVPSNGLYVGEFPKNDVSANSPITFGSTTFARLDWDYTISYLKKGKHRRIHETMIHELWHVKQEKFGHPAACYFCNSHLDERDGRIWIQMELKALAKAILEKEETIRSTYLKDALTFRYKRRSLFPDMVAKENEMEMHEGMANYTGYKIAGYEDMWEAMSKSALVKYESFVAQFAYNTTPIYGTILDDLGVKWFDEITYQSDIASYLMKYYKYDIEKISSDFHLKESCSRFDCEEIIKSENAVSEKKKNLVEKLKSELQIDALVIEVDSTTAFGFDPSQITESKSLDGTILVEGMILTKDGMLEFSRPLLWKSDVVLIPWDNAKRENSKITSEKWEYNLKAADFDLEVDGNLHVIKKKH